MALSSTVFCWGISIRLWHRLRLPSSKILQATRSGWPIGKRCCLQCTNTHGYCFPNVHKWEYRFGLILQQASLTSPPTPPAIIFMKPKYVNNILVIERLSPFSHASVSSTGLWCPYLLWGNCWSTSSFPGERQMRWHIDVLFSFASADETQGNSQKAVDSSLLFTKILLYEVFFPDKNSFHLVWISSHKVSLKLIFFTGFKGVSRRSQACSCWGKLSGFTFLT